jgi:hypothetical protein
VFGAALGALCIEDGEFPVSDPLDGAAPIG